MDLSTLPGFSAYAGTAYAHLATSAEERAVLENFRLEERISDDRLARYVGAHREPPVADWNSLNTHQQRYARRHQEIDVGEIEAPDTFDLKLNAGNRWPGVIESNLYLLRLESAEFAANCVKLDVKDLEAALADRKHKEVVLQDLCTAWNTARDRRPAFATTELAVKDMLDAAGDNWPNALRDELGLGQWNPSAGSAGVPVLLMRYQVKDVLADQSSGAARFAIPTVIDSSKLSAYFFPTPIPVEGSPTAACLAGRTVNLAATDAAGYRMGLELLHSRLTYRPEHLWKFGIIDRPLKLNLAEQRGFHLALVREICDRADFGAT